MQPFGKTKTAWKSTVTIDSEVKLCIEISENSMSLQVEPEAERIRDSAVIFLLDFEQKARWMKRSKTDFSMGIWRVDGDQRSVSDVSEPGANMTNDDTSPLSWILHES